MKDKTESRQLLDDILEEVAPPAFRAEMLAGTLKQARGRVRTRQRNRALLMAAAVVLAGLFVWKKQMPHNETQPAPSSGLAVLPSVPLESSQVLETAPGSVRVIRSFADMVAVVETGSSPRGFRELDDAQLLALLDGTPSVLVRQGPHQEELLIVDASTLTARLVDNTYQRDMPNQ